MDLLNIYNRFSWQIIVVVGLIAVLVQFIIRFMERKEIKSIQDWMNNYPRKILGGKSPLEALIDEFGNSFKIPALLEI